MDNNSLRMFFVLQQGIDDMQILLDKKLCDLVAQASIQDDKIFFNRCAIILRGEYEQREFNITNELEKYVNEKLASGAEEYKAAQRVFENSDYSRFTM